MLGAMEKGAQFSGSDLASIVIPDNDSDGSYEETPESCHGQVSCIFTGEVYPSPEQYFTDLKRSSGFDIWQIALCDLSLDFFKYVKVINFLRKAYFEKTPPTSDELEKLRPQWDSDEYLKPVIEDDPLLQFMLDEGDDDMSDEEIAAVRDMAVGLGDTENVVLLKQKLLKTEKANEKLSLQLQNAQNQIGQMKSFMQDIILTGDVGIYRPVAACRQDTSCYEDEEFEDSGYFGTYSHHDIHAEMLQDRVRTNAYRDIILNNKECFKDKIVLDVGCGTGILSMFAAQAGAKHIYGIDMSEIAYQAMDIIKENGLAEKITILKGRIEEVELPVTKVDIIISEWMGYFLLYESMLDSVLFARDKWLATGGELYPNYCTISLCAIHDEALVSSNVSFWDNVYGFKMSSLRKQVLCEAAIQVINKSAVMSDPFVVHTLDLNTAKGKDLKYKSDFTLKINRNGLCSAVVGYFDIFQNNTECNLMFSTSPLSQPTHWKQVVFFFGESQKVSEGDVLHGKMDCHKNAKDPRSLVINLTIGEKNLTYKIE